MSLPAAAGRSIDHVLLRCHRKTRAYIC